MDFKILDKNGRPPFRWERGPKHTVYVGEGDKVRAIARFGPHNGKYMIHCHNLVHEDHDMMTQLRSAKSTMLASRRRRARPAKPNPEAILLGG